MRWNNLVERPTASWRSDSLDLLRALLALYVIFVHLAEWHPAAPGALTSAEAWTVRVFQPHGETNPAVLAFIALSGYCIHRNGARADGGWSIRAFGIRRAFRILPVFLTATAFAAVVFDIASSRSSYVTQITDTASISTGCLAAKLSGAAAFAPGLLRCSYQANAPLNTVMVEIWLYAVYGLVAWLLLRRIRERLLLALIAALSISGFLVVEANPDLLGWWGNSSLVGFLAYWWVGAAAVAASPRTARRLLLGGGCTWLVLTLLLREPHSAHVVLAGAELRKLALVCTAAGAFRLLDRPQRLPAALTALGRSGYSLYAFHAPLLVLVVAYGFPWWLGFLLPVVTAAVTYRMVERPGIRLGRIVATARRDVALPLQPEATTSG